jgi:hypothetical protein
MGWYEVRRNYTSHQISEDEKGVGLERDNKLSMLFFFWIIYSVPC